MSADLDVLIDELYALPLERFVPERDVLARQLRAEGRREDAARIAALTKPTIVAWAVNQVVRAQAAAAATLWAAGDAVLDTQAQVVAGEAAGSELRAAIEAERHALEPLADAARGLMTGSGRFLGEQNIQPVTETLHAAAIDPSARPDVAAGRLTRPLRLTGLEAALASTSTGTRAVKEAENAVQRERLTARRRKDTKQETERRRLDRELRAQQQAAERALLRAERDRDKARERIATAVRERDKAQAEVEAQRRRLLDAEQALAEQEQRLATAHGALEEAEDAVDRARAEVEGA